MLFWIRGVALAALLMAAGPANALRIITNYAAPGQSIPSVGEATGPPSSAVGDGELASIVRAAADTWESVIDDSHTLTLTFGWFPTTGVSNSAYHVAGAAIGTPLREITGSLAFNSDDSLFPMYLDPTPTLSEEFSLEAQDFTDLGAGPIETARHFRATTSLASRKNDVYTAALHEIGHALGLTQLASFDAETRDGDIDITIPGFQGTAIPVRGTHLELDGPLLSNRARDVGQRRGISQADLLAVCQISGFGSCNTAPAPIPQPGDLNADGLVNAADYTVWRDDLSGSTSDSEAIYEAWADRYGATQASASSGVPEPTTIALLLLGSGLVQGRRRRAG